MTPIFTPAEWHAQQDMGDLGAQLHPIGPLVPSGAVRAKLSALWGRTRPSRPPERPPRAPRVGLPAAAVAGVGPAGEAMSVDGLSSGGEDLVALLFLTSSCHGCREIWAALGHQGLPGAPRTVVVTPGPELEDRRKVAALAPKDVPVLMSARAWADYDVSRSPFAVVVRDGRIAGEGPLRSWADLCGLVERR